MGLFTRPSIFAALMTGKPMNLTDKTLQFILDASWQGLPVEVRHQAKRCLLDALGALIAGTATPVARLMADFAGNQFHGDEATILAGGKRASCAGAALANGFAQNALDIDDGYRLVKGHPGACILPVLLAVSEIPPKTSGTAFLTALVVGYEVGIRAGMIRHALYQAYHASGSWGAVSGAAAAGKLLGVDADILRKAMGTAEYHAPIAPMMKGIATPSMGKDGIGWGCMVAISSLLMAQHGFTGIEPIFSDAPEREWIESLGRRYEILSLYFKPYAACRWAQPAVAGALEIARSNHLQPHDIERVRVRTFAAAAALSCSHPKDTEEAQYHLSFPIAAALFDSEVGPRQVLPPRIHDASLLELADRVEVEVEDSFEKAFPAKALAEVTVDTRDGRQFASGTMEARWEPPDTLPTDAELEAKFFRLVEPLLGASRTKSLVSTVWHMEKVDALEPFLNLCIVGQGDGKR
jgi:2-methylcitrate dehydratase PrpD